MLLYPGVVTQDPACAAYARVESERRGGRSAGGCRLCMGAKDELDWGLVSLQVPAASIKFLDRELSHLFFAKSKPDSY